MKRIKDKESLVRLQKIISQAGISSRREAERLILEGRVSVNGDVVTELGAKANPLVDDIRLDGKRVKKSLQKVYILLNKPKGCVTTVKDDRGRLTVIDFLKGIKKKIYPIGRLDFNTEGVLLLTNDGDFAYRLAHPRHKIPKTYSVKISGVPTEKEIKKLSDGVVVYKRKTAPAQVILERVTGNNSWLSVTLHEGRKRQIRKMCEIIGHPVIKLKRVKYGFLDLGNLRAGEYRNLGNHEVKKLMGMAGR